MRRYGGLSRTPRLYLAAALILTAILLLILVRLGLSWLLAYLVGINAMTLCFYGFDKLQARRQGPRVPEIALHALAALGGTPGGFAGQLLFRHKTRAGRFRLIFFTIVVIQAAVLLVYAWKR